MEDNEGWDARDDAYEMSCSGIERAGPQDTSDSKPGEEHMAWFAKVVDLYEQKECRCFQCGSANHLIHKCVKDSDGTTGVPLNYKEGMTMMGGQASQRKQAMQWACQTKTPFLNPNPYNRWCGIENVAQVWVN